MITSPKEKANELFQKFYVRDGYNLPKWVALQSALIAVDLIIENDPYEPYDGGYYELPHDRIDDAVKYWEQVKEAINQL